MGEQLGTAYDTRNGGTQYAISSASFYRTNISSVVTWAIVNTSLIAQVPCPAYTPPPSLVLDRPSESLQPSYCLPR